MKNYEFNISYSKATGEISTSVRMPSGILLKGLAYTLAEYLEYLEMMNSLDIYIDELRLQIKQIRQDNGA